MLGVPLSKHAKVHLMISFPSFLEGLQKSLSELLLLHTEKNSEWPNLLLSAHNDLVRSDVTGGSFNSASAFTEAAMCWLLWITLSRNVKRTC